MDNIVRAAVAARADYRCEYCQLRESDDIFAFHVEHVVAVKHGGTGDLENLAYACQHCNLHKGPNLSGIDPDTQALVPLFQPRGQAWADHFVTADFRLVGRTPVGRATVRVLAMNDPDRVQLRMMLATQN